MIARQAWQVETLCAAIRKHVREDDRGCTCELLREFVTDIATSLTQLEMKREQG